MSLGEYPSLFLNLNIESPTVTILRNSTSTVDSGGTGTVFTFNLATFTVPAASVREGVGSESLPLVAQA